MKLPVLRGLIDRRILVNYHVDPDVLASVLPPPFRPKLVDGMGLAGICLIRLKQVRPRFVPSLVGVSSENAAHRIAVEWNQGGERREGVYIPRRDTSSRLNALVGGRLFPGVHHRARFQVEERNDRITVVLDSDDGEVHVAVSGRIALKLPGTSLFSSVEEASDFFRCGSLGFSTTAEAGVYDGLELRTFGWDVTPFTVERVESSYFENKGLFPAGSVEFDSALLMRNLPHEWRGCPPLYADSPRPSCSNDNRQSAATTVSRQ
ncbi:MAG: DUF2071 domain-containing protein [Planctomycetaceae bacterium]